MKKFVYDHFPSGKWKRPLSLMRLSIMALVCSIGSMVAAPSFSQQIRINVSYDKTSLISVLNDLKARSGYEILYSDEAIPRSATVTLSRKNITVEEVLNETLFKNGLTYTIKDDVIVISPTKVQATQQQPVQGQIQGTVKDHDGRPLMGITVLVKNTNRAIATDSQGKYAINAFPSETLTFTFIGKKPVEVVYNGQNTINVVMEEKAADIDEVVVTGIFDRARESYTGAVTTITAKELSTFRGQNLIATLRNIDPSINIMMDNEAGSNPNALPQINIRGNSSLPTNVKDFNEGVKYDINTPLIIMDGFEISLTKLMDFNDEEIQSINILKDAAATAIYGSRGANGVIVIISKTPPTGQLSVSFSAGISLEIPDLSSYDLLNAPEKLELERLVGLYEGNNINETLKYQQIYAERLKDVLEGVNTDWLSKPVRTGVGQRYNLSIGGGSNEFRWGATLGYGNTVGVMKGSSRQNFNGAVTLSYSYKDVIFRNQTSVGVNKGIESKYGSFSKFTTLEPYDRPYDENGIPVKLFDNIHKTGTVGNPLYDAGLNSFNQSKYTEITNNFSIDWNIAQGFKLRGQFGISRKFNSSDVFLPPSHSSFSSYLYDYAERDTYRGSYDYATGEATKYEGNITLSYTKTFNEKHLLYAGINYSMSQDESLSNSISAEGFTDEDARSLNNAMQYKEGTKPSYKESESRRLGFSSNVNYTYDNRYYIDGSLRVDGSSQFGSNQRFAPFWSIGLGWNLHNEAFFGESRFVNSLRLKASYGQTGSQQFPAYQAIPTFKYYDDRRYAFWSAAELMGFGNNDLKWQKTNQYNFGIALSILDGRLTGGLDYYMKATSNLLSSMDIPKATGFSSYTNNVGAVRNTGIEASLSGYIIRNAEKGITWMAGVRLSSNKNKITKLSDDVKKQNEEYSKTAVVGNLFYEGRSQNSLYAVRSLGIDPSTGREILLDIDGNRVDKWYPKDKVYIGVAEPKFRGNMSTMFTYKNLSVNLSFAFHWGGVINNITLRDKVEVNINTISTQNVDRRVFEQRWMEAGDISYFKRITNSTTRYVTSRFIVKDSTFEIQTLNVQYRIDGEWIKKYGVRSVSISANMSDILYLSTVKRERGTGYPFANRVGLTLGFIF